MKQNKLAEEGLRVKIDSSIWRAVEGLRQNYGEDTITARETDYIISLFRSEKQTSFLEGQRELRGKIEKLKDDNYLKLGGPEGYGLRRAEAGLEHKHYCEAIDDVLALEGVKYGRYKN